MADSFFTLSSSVILKVNKKIKPIVSNRLYRFNSKKTWNDVFDEVADPDEIGMRKTDEVVVNVSDISGLQTFEPDMSESIEVVQEFDNKLTGTIWNRTKSKRKITMSTKKNHTWMY